MVQWAELGLGCSTAPAIPSLPALLPPCQRIVSRVSYKGIRDLKRLRQYVSLGVVCVLSVSVYPPWPSLPGTLIDGSTVATLKLLH